MNIKIQVKGDEQLYLGGIFDHTRIYDILVGIDEVFDTDLYDVLKINSMYKVGYGNYINIPLACGSFDEVLKWAYHMRDVPEDKAELVIKYGYNPTRVDDIEILGSSKEDVIEYFFEHSNVMLKKITADMEEYELTESIYRHMGIQVEYDEKLGNTIFWMVKP